MVEQVVAFKTNDGKLFENQRDAMMYEKQEEFEMSLTKWLEPLELQTGDSVRLMSRLKGNQGRILMGVLINYFGTKGGDSE